jgi:phosphoribosyl 1,2-cyclic phosphate phosphodiesterase
LKVTFLGTGTSQGVPVIGCSCKVCKSSNEHDKRLRSSVLVEVGSLSIVIDSGPDFRQQMLKAVVRKMDGILITHEHKDHIAGLDDVRAFNWINNKPMDVYAEKRVIKAIKREFEYAFEKDPYPGVPQIHLTRIDESPFTINSTCIIPIRGKHMHLPVLGFRIQNFTYLTDFNFIEESELEKVKGSKVLVVNGLRKEPHISHFTLDEAVAVIQKAKPQKGYITHISHQLGLSKDIRLPNGIELAYDMLAIEL